MLDILLYEDEDEGSKIQNLFPLCVLRFGLLGDGKIGIGVLPKSRWAAPGTDLRLRGNRTGGQHGAESGHGYQDTLQEARGRNNQKAVQDLEGIAPYPPSEPDSRKMLIVREWQRDLLARSPDAAGFLDGKRVFTGPVSTPEYSLMDDYGFIQGMQFSMDVLLPDVAKVGLARLGLDFQVPIFFFEGRYAPYGRPSLIADYLQAIQAPQKEIVWFENSGHFPFFEERQKYLEPIAQPSVRRS